jgi:hypothetical protein
LVTVLKAPITKLPLLPLVVGAAWAAPADTIAAATAIILRLNFMGISFKLVCEKSAR